MDGEKRRSDEATPLPDRARLGILISSGMHSGAWLDALALPATIGSNLACDVVLSDSGIMPRHLRLYSEHGTLFAAALQDAVDIHGHGRLQPGHGVRIQLPLNLTIGHVRLQLLACDGHSGPRPTWMSWSHYAWRRKRRAALGLAVVAVLVAGPVVFAGFSPTSGRQTDASLSSDSFRDRIDHHEVGTFLRHALVKAQLANVTLRRDHTAWIVTGDLDPVEYEQWLDVRRAAEVKYGTGLVIESKINGNGLKPPHIPIAAIRLGEHPYIIDDRGKRHAPGETLPGGWILARLDDHALVWRHGTTEHTLSY